MVNTVDYELPSGLRIEGVPADLSREEVKKQAIARGLATEDDFNPNLGMRDSDYKKFAKSRSGMDNFLAGMGGAMVGYGLGAGQAVGLVDQATVDEHRRAMAGLKSTTAGSIGEFVGLAAPVAATAVIPGANTYGGAALIGALSGASQPTLEGESRLVNTALGTAGGLGGQYIGNKAAGYAARRLAQKTTDSAQRQAVSATRDATLNQAKEAGYVTPPSYQGAGLVPRMAEGLSGKYKTNQLAGIRNQQVTDRLARRALGLDETADLTPEVLRGMRQQAFRAGYEPVRQAGTVVPDRVFLKELDDITGQFRGASRSFPGLVDDAVSAKIDALRVTAFDAGDAVDTMKLLREEASKAFRSGDNALGHALKRASSALEKQLERHLRSQGEDGVALLRQFKDARQMIAKTHTVEDALVEGSGQVDATKLASMLKRGDPLTGELRLIGKYGQAFRDVSRVPKSGDANPFTIIDYGYGAAAGAGIDPTLFALPAARLGVRHSLLSRPVQNMMGPSYDVGALTRGLPPVLNSNMAQGMLRAMPAAGLLGMDPMTIRITRDASDFPQ